MLQMLHIGMDERWFLWSSRREAMLHIGQQRRSEKSGWVVEYRAGSRAGFWIAGLGVGLGSGLQVLESGRAADVRSPESYPRTPCFLCLLQTFKRDAGYTTRAHVWVLLTVKNNNGKLETRTKWAGKATNNPLRSLRKNLCGIYFRYFFKMRDRIVVPRNADCKLKLTHSNGRQASLMDHSRAWPALLGRNHAPFSFRWRENNAPGTASPILLNHVAIVTRSICLRRLKCFVWRTQAYFSAVDKIEINCIVDVIWSLLQV